MAYPSSTSPREVDSFFWCAWAFSPGPKFTAAMPRAANRATSVHARLGSTPRTPDAASALTSGWLAAGGAASSS